MESIKNPIIAYAIIIIYFAIIYNIAWLISPDSFIKNNVLNSNPVHDAVNLVFAYNEVKNEDPNSVSHKMHSE